MARKSKISNETTNTANNGIVADAVIHQIADMEDGTPVINGNGIVVDQDTAQVFEPIPTPEAATVAQEPIQASSRRAKVLAAIQQSGRLTQLTRDAVLTQLRQRWRSWLVGQVETEPNVNTAALAGASSGAIHNQVLSVVRSAANDGKWDAATWSVAELKKGGAPDDVAPLVIGPVWWRVRAELRTIVSEFSPAIVLMTCRAVIAADSYRTTFCRPVGSDGAPMESSAWFDSVVACEGDADCLACLAEVEEKLWSEWAFSAPRGGFIVPRHRALLNLPADLIAYLS